MSDTSLPFGDLDQRVSGLRSQSLSFGRDGVQVITTVSLFIT